MATAVTAARVIGGFNIFNSSHLHVNADLKNEIVAGAFIVGCFFAIVVMNLMGYNADNCFLPQ